MLIQPNQPKPRAMMLDRQFSENRPFYLKIARGILVDKEALTLFCILMPLIPLLFLPFVEFASANFDYHAPIVTVISPVTDMVYDDQSSISLSVKVEMHNWDMTNSEELAEVKYSLDGQLDVAATIKNEIKEQGNGIEGFATATISGMAKGAHALFIHGQTTFSKYSSVPTSFSRTVYFVVGTVTPTIQIVSPQQTAYNSITVQLEYKSDKPLTWAGYSLDQNMVVACLDNATLTNLSNGVHSVRIYGTDSAGKVYTSKEIVFSVNGKNPPVVTIDVEAIVNARKYLPSDFHNRTYWHLVFHVNEPTSWMGYSIDGGAIQTIDGNKTLSFSYGSYTIIVYAADLCGNIGASNPHAFTLAAGEAGSAYASPTAPPTSQPELTSEPSPSNNLFPMALVVASAALVALVASTCVVLFKWNHSRKNDV
jgi:hypothetical protein